jgi:hypothetical protein
VLVADTTRSRLAGSVSVTRAGRRTALPVFRTEIVNLTRSPTITVLGLALLRTEALATGSGGAVRHLWGNEAVAVATRCSPAKLTVQVTACDEFAPRTVNAIRRNPALKVSGWPWPAGPGLTALADPIGTLTNPLGSARSHGCIRLANDSIDWLVATIGAARLPGTPVQVS